MFAVSTFDAVGGLILGTIGAFGLVVNDLFEQWRNGRDRRRGAPMKRYLAFDIGCIECGEPSAVLGVFMSRDEANLAAEHAKRVQRENWLGQHYFEVYEIEVPS